jgi:predicted phosphodiesterase
VIRRTASRFGLIADVHANLQALETVLAHLDSHGVEEIWCLGDVVGYGGDPGPCIDIVRRRCAGTVQGNHDAAAVRPELRTTFNPHARVAIEVQAELLAPEELAWLGTLPLLIELDDVVLLHGSVAEPAEFGYVLTAPDARRELSAMTTRWGFFGHTHVPAGWRMAPDGAVEALALPVPPAELAVDRPGRYLINPGAVGQPRNGDPRASCAIFERGPGRLRRVALDYDVGAAQSAILRSGMPPIEAERLVLGR